MIRSLLLVVVLAVLYICAEGQRCKAWDDQSSGYCGDPNVCCKSDEKTQDECKNACAVDRKCRAFEYRAGVCYHCEGNCDEDRWMMAQDFDVRYECLENP